MDQNIAIKQGSSSPRLWNSKGPHVYAVLQKVRKWIYIRQLSWEIHKEVEWNSSGQEKIWGVLQSKYRTYENLGERTMWTEYVGYKVSWGEMEGVTWTF